MQFIDLAAQQELIRDALNKRISSVLDDGNYIMGPEVKELESNLADFSGAKHVLGCANGTDALQLALMALGCGKGDAVFCPTFTFAATAEVVPLVGGTPVFVDSDESSFNLDSGSLKRALVHARELGLRPRGVIAVDLFGLPADYDAIEAIVREEGMWLIADSAQGFGSVYKGRKSGTIGDIATTSFFPAKPLGCYGDGGALFTENDELAATLNSYRVHGKGTDKYDNERIGLNSRLDTIQAAILLEKLAIYSDEIDARQEVAKRYNAGLSNVVKTPVVPEDCLSVWAQYTVQATDGDQRTKLMGALKAENIPSVVYYPRPLHQQNAYKNFPSDPEGLQISEKLSQTVFSLPMSAYVEAADQTRIIDILRIGFQNQNPK